MRRRVLPRFTTADTLLGFAPFKGFPRPAMGPLSQALLSRTLLNAHRALRLGSRSPGTPEYHSPTVWLFSKEIAVLPGLSSLFTLHILVKPAGPWLMVSPRIPEYVAASWQTLCGVHLLRPE
jgi:hypothetical protein